MIHAPVTLDTPDPTTPLFLNGQPNPRHLAMLSNRKWWAMHHGDRVQSRNARRRWAEYLTNPDGLTAKERRRQMIELAAFRGT